MLGSKLLTTLCFAGLLSAVLSVPTGAGAEDTRVVKARELRDEILARRGSAKPAHVAENPYLGALADAEANLASIDAQIAENRQRAQRVLVPREKLVARGQELAAEAEKLRGQQRARVEAVYRSAKLGAGAAGWQPEPARSARLARYLVSIAAVQREAVTKVEVEQGSIIAALDQSRIEEEAAVADGRVLAVDRIEAEAGLERAMADADLRPPSRAVVASAQSEDGALNNNATAGDPVGGGLEPDALAGADSALEAAGDLESQTAIERAAQELQAQAGVAPTANADVPVDDALVDKAATAAAQLETEAAAAEKAVAEAEGKAAADAAAAEAETVAAAAREAQAAEKELAEEAWREKLAARKAEIAAAQSAASADVASAKPAVAADDEGLPELEDGPAVLAPSSPPPEEEKPATRGVLSRLFGNDRGSDEFAAARGTMPAPIPGKVVANYGQRHKSGATYRGVIIRAAHGLPVTSVSEGKISYVGSVAGLGNTVIVEHGGRYHTVYSRLGPLSVKEGQIVHKGTKLGELPQDDADLHFEVRDKGSAVDPLPWLSGGGR